MEVLVALGIFALGFVAVAAIFPTATMMQRNTARDVEARHAARSASAVISNTQFTTSELLNLYYPSDGTDDGASETRELTTFDEDGNLDNFWPLSTRSHPSIYADPHQRGFYWLPLIRDKDESTSQSWQIVVFVLHRRDDKTYSTRDYRTNADAPWSASINEKLPAVANMGLSGNTNDTFTLNSSITVRQNDWVVDSNGSLYRVQSVNSAGDEVTVDGRITGSPSEIWYAPPPDGETVSPAVRVFQINLGSI